MSRLRALAIAGTAALGMSAGAAFEYSEGFLRSHEGMVLTGYRDIVGVPTACAGHTATAVVGKKYTDAECVLLLKGDHAHAFRTLERTTGSVFKVLNKDEVLSYTSFIFNLGSGNWGSSTLLRELNQERYRSACNQILQWNRTGGIDCSRNGSGCVGIWQRRLDERDICMYGKDAWEARRKHP